MDIFLQEIPCFLGLAPEPAAAASQHARQQWLVFGAQDPPCAPRFVKFLTALHYSFARKNAPYRRGSFWKISESFGELIHVRGGWPKPLGRLGGATGAPPEPPERFRPTSAHMEKSTKALTVPSIIFQNEPRRYGAFFGAQDPPFGLPARARAPGIQRRGGLRWGSSPARPQSRALRGGHPAINPFWVYPRGEAPPHPPVPRRFFRRVGPRPRRNSRSPPQVPA